MGMDRNFFFSVMYVRIEKSGLNSSLGRDFISATFDFMHAENKQQTQWRNAILPAP